MLLPPSLIKGATVPQKSHKRVLKGMAMGGKVWLFCPSDEGAMACDQTGP